MEIKRISSRMLILFWYSIGELRILAYGKSAVLREPSAARLDPSLLECPPDTLTTLRPSYHRSIVISFVSKRIMLYFF